MRGVKVLLAFLGGVVFTVVGRLGGGRILLLLRWVKYFLCIFILLRFYFKCVRRERCEKKVIISKCFYYLVYVEGMC